MNCMTPSAQTLASLRHQVRMLEETLENEARWMDARAGDSPNTQRAG